jgi:hypothetical protein
MPERKVRVPIGFIGFPEVVFTRLTPAHVRVDTTEVGRPFQIPVGTLLDALDALGVLDEALRAREVEKADA